MPDWNPQLYNRFRGYRAEPVEHILSRLPLDGGERILDLGCGPGENTLELARRAARATAHGIDLSPAMIESASQLRARQPPELKERLSFAVGDIGELAGIGAFNVIFSNAAMQWLRHHRKVLTSWYGALESDGRMVVQMPANEHETGKVELSALAQSPRWRDRLGGLDQSFREVPSPEHYAKMLTEIGFTDVDCYHVTFLHPLERPDDVVQWYRATGLRPFLDVLPESQHDEFLHEYRERLERAYGTTGPMTFNFRRLFIWGRRPVN
jgi:trans-aconitate 2-methyltransferase